MHDETFEELIARAEALIADHEDMMQELVKLRLKHNLSQETVAERMGVTQPRVSQFERYDANPTLDTVRRYASAVGARLETRVIDDHASYLPARQPAAPIESATTKTPKSPVSWGSSLNRVMA